MLFAVIFYWTPPHFWALAIRYRDDYAAADVPMLPAVASLRPRRARILIYTVLLWALTLVVRARSRSMGHIYLGRGHRPRRRLHRGSPSSLQRDADAAMRLFPYSITYVTLLFAAMAVDQLIRDTE